MQLLDQDAIAQMNRFDRVNFIHSLTGYKSPILIGTKGEHENLAVFSSIIHLGSNPALLGIKFRPENDYHHTYRNIHISRELTLNMVNRSFYQKAHHTSIRAAASESEFSLSGLTPHYRESIASPFVLESPIQIWAKYAEEYQIKANNTCLMVVAIEKVWHKPGLLNDDYSLALDKAGIVALNGLYGYNSCKPLDKLTYVHTPK